METKERYEAGPDKENFQIGFDHNQNPAVMIISVPILKYSLDLEGGSAMLRGRLDEAKIVGLKVMGNIRKAKQNGGLVVPANNVKLSVQ